MYLKYLGIHVPEIIQILFSITFKNFLTLRTGIIIFIHTGIQKLKTLFTFLLFFDTIRVIYGRMCSDRKSHINDENSGRNFFLSKIS